MNEYLATAVDEAYRLGVRDVVFSPVLAPRLWRCYLRRTINLIHI